MGLLVDAYCAYLFDFGCLLIVYLYIAVGCYCWWVFRNCALGLFGYGFKYLLGLM